MPHPSTLRFLSLFIFFLAIACQTFAQPAWKTVQPGDLKGQSARYLQPKQASYLEIRLDQLRQQLLAAPMEANEDLKNYGLRIELPMPDGSTQTFAIARYAMLPPTLSARFPAIVTCLGQGISDPSAQVYLDVTEQGFHAQILRSGPSVYIDPVFHNETVYHQSYLATDIPESSIQPFSCGTHQKASDPKQVNLSDKSGNPPSVSFVNGGIRKEYRIAIAFTAQYTQLQGGTVAQGMSAVASILNRVNGLFGRQMAVRFNLIPNNDLLIYTAEPDPYTNEDVNTMAGENQINTDLVIGFANYDIGHVISRNGGGLAAGQACGAGKAGGSSGLNTPLTDVTNLTTVYHEIAHQLDADHTWNGTIGGCVASQYSPLTAVEPGSGVTIMSYNGACGDDNLGGARLEHFHQKSLEQMTFFIQSGVGNTCGTTISTGNVPPLPLLLMPNGLTIPHSTPYELRGTGIDADGDSVYLCWEQTDVGAPGPPNDPSRVDGPLTHSFSPSVSAGIRTIPSLEDLQTNSISKGNLLGTASRTMNFALTARDNRPGAGGIRDTAFAFNVTSSAGPFSVIIPVAAQVVQSGSVQTVSWSVANTNLPPVNCSEVAIKLSLDEGRTYPFTLAAATPNDGVQNVTFPDTTTTTARIRVEAVGNIFFDISNQNFSIEKYCGLSSICSGEFGNHFIHRVKLNTLDNSLSGCAGSGYRFFTQTTELTAGGRYPMTIALGTAATDHGVAAWIDFNNDGDFTDVGEMILSLPPGSGSRTDTVTIPGKASFLGARRMRVRSGYQHTFSATQACFPIGFGETEDYTVTIKGYCFEHSVCSSTLGGNHTITRVRIASLDNPSGCSPTGYSDFTTTAGPIPMEHGRIYTLQINKSAEFAEGIGVWMDLNEDSDFDDPGEFVFQKAPEAGPLMTGSFRIPNFRLQARMRIRMGFNKTWTAADACAFVNFGETEDYTVRSAGSWFSTSICSSPEFGDHYISNFSFAGINNSSSCEGDGYTLYPESQLLGVVGLGQTYSGHVSVSPGQPHGNGLWIDFGNKGSFGGSDLVASTPNSSFSNNEWDFNVTVPSDTFYLGRAKVRIRTAYNQIFDDLGASWNFGFGETEDYYIDVRLEVMASPIFGPVCSGKSMPLFFNTFGIFPEGNVFRAELSDRNGLFTHPILIGSGSQYPITVTFPDTLTAGNNYKIRLISSLPAGISSVLHNIAIRKAPVITSMVPASGSPGTLITFTGTNLQSVGAIFFGQMAGADFNMAADSSSFTVVVPEGATTGEVFIGGACVVVGPVLTVQNSVAATPVISHPSGTYADPISVTLSSATPEAQIYYTTSGNIPVLGTGYTRLYTGPVPVISSTTIRAIGVRSGYTNSGVAVSFITINNPGIVATPVISPGGGSFGSGQTVSISCSTTGASVYYTTNGNVPVIGTSFTRLYTAPFFINTTSTIRALGVKADIVNSPIALANLTITTPTPTVATPVISPGTGIYAGVQTVSISTSTPGASIYYTTNGNVPRFDVPNGFTRLYSGPFILSSSATVRAIATQPGFVNSATAVSFITIGAGRVAVAEEDNPVSNLEVQVWPNPSSGVFYLNPTDYDWNLAEVYSMDGRKILLKEGGMEQLDLGREPAGIYLLHINGPHGTRTYRLVKK